MSLLSLYDSCHCTCTSITFNRAVILTASSIRVAPRKITNRYIYFMPSHFNKKSRDITNVKGGIIGLPETAVDFQCSAFKEIVSFYSPECCSLFHESMGSIVLESVHIDAPQQFMGNVLCNKSGFGLTAVSNGSLGEHFLGCKWLSCVLTLMKIDSWS